MVLLSAAIVFAGLGWLGLSGSDGDGGNSGGDATVAATTTDAPPATTQPAPAPPDEDAAPDTSAPESPSTTPTTTANSAAALRVPLRVYNNSTVDGLAATAADRLRAEGWNVTDVSNYGEGQIPQSTAYYGTRPGEKEAAEKLAQEMGIAVAPRFDGILDAPAGVIVILTGNTAAN